MTELMSLEDLAVVERWNKADMRCGRHYATKPSITQITQMINSIHAAHKLKERVEELEAEIEILQAGYKKLHSRLDDFAIPLD